MGLRDTFRLRRNAAAESPVDGGGYLNYYVPRSMGFVSLVPALGQARWDTFRGIYLTNPWVHGTVNKIARNVAQVPIYVYALDDRGRKTRVRGDLPQTVGRPTGGQSLDSLLNTGFQGRSRQAILTQTMKERLYLGNALWRIIRDGAGMPANLIPIRWRDLIMVDEDDNGNPVFYQLRTRHGGSVYYLDPGDVVHFGLGTDSEFCYGVSPLEGARATLALYDALMRHLVGYMKNSAAPSGYVQLPDGVTPKRAREIRDLTMDLYTSPENAGKILMSVGKWQPVGNAPDQSQIIELIKTSREEILTIFDAPPTQVGITDKAPRAVAHEQRDQWVRETIGPWAMDFAGDVTAQLLPLVPSWRSLRVEFSFREKLQPDPEAMADVVDKELQVLTVDEIREDLGFPPLDIPGVSDTPWSKPGAAPLTAAAAPRPPTVIPPALEPDPPAGT